MNLTVMKCDIHPNYQQITVSCSCGHSFTTGSTLEKNALQIEVCSKCHPFYTGQQKLVDTAGRVEKFLKKFGQSNTTSHEKDVSKKKKD